jgi:hypothetical protein
MAGKVFTEPIQVVSFGKTRVPGGGYVKGTETVKFNSVAKINTSPQSRYLQDSGSDLSKRVTFEFYRNPLQLIDSNDSINWKSKTYKIENVIETDNYRKYKVTAIEQ